MAAGSSTPRAPAASAPILPEPTLDEPAKPAAPVPVVTTQPDAPIALPDPAPNEAPTPAPLAKPHAPSPTHGAVLVDTSCLQDPAYRSRGIGLNALAILAGRHQALRAHPELAFMRLIGVTNPALPPIAPADAALFDEIRPNAYDGPPPLAMINLSPMTHDLTRLARASLRARLRCAFVHDFIPFDFAAEYLTDENERLCYLARMVWLREQDVWFANSRDTAERLGALLGAPPDRITVTGVAVRETMQPMPAGTGQGPSAPGLAREWILVTAGDNWRKNLETAIDAHARSATLAARGIRLLVLGGYSEERQTGLRARHQAAGGKPDLLRFLPHLSDDALRGVIARALLAIVPSRAEGFSIPVTEASAQSTPVLVSDIPAHRELVADPQDRFDPDEPNELQNKIETLIRDDAAMAAIRERQAGIWRPFSAEKVAARFWDRFAQAVIALPPAPAIGGRKPRVAFISALPPARSGVADHSGGTLEALSRRAEVIAYSQTPRPRVAPGQIVQPLNQLAHLSPHYDAVIAVTGAAEMHLSVTNNLLEFGAAVIAHDSRMLGFYSMLYGYDRAVALAAEELGRPVSRQEYDHWLSQNADPPALMLGEIARAARPLFMNSVSSARLISERYGVEVKALPFPVQRALPDDEVSEQGRATARRALGLADDAIHIATFGHVHADRAPEDLIWATEMLVAWGFNARLDFIGPVEPDVRDHYMSVAATLGIAGRVSFTGGFINEANWRLWLRAADLAVQLRTYGLGQISGALADAQASGIPSVASQGLAEAQDSPRWVARVPDAISAVLVAEKLAEMITQGGYRKRDLPARAELLAARTYDVYAEKLLAALGIDTRQPAP